jgi:hypothetical protein
MTLPTWKDHFDHEKGEEEIESEETDARRQPIGARGGGEDHRAEISEWEESSLASLWLTAFFNRFWIGSNSDHDFALWYVAEREQGSLLEWLHRKKAEIEDTGREIGSSSHHFGVSVFGVYSDHNIFEIYRILSLVDLALGVLPLGSHKSDFNHKSQSPSSPISDGILYAKSLACEFGQQLCNVSVKRGHRPKLRRRFPLIGSLLAERRNPQNVAHIYILFTNSEFRRLHLGGGPIKCEFHWLNELPSHGIRDSHPETIRNRSISFSKQYPALERAAGTNIVVSCGGLKGATNEIMLGRGKRIIHQKQFFKSWIAFNRGQKDPIASSVVGFNRIRIYHHGGIPKVCYLNKHQHRNGVSVTLVEPSACDYPIWGEGARRGWIKQCSYSGRKLSFRLGRRCLRNRRQIFLVFRFPPRIESTEQNDIYEAGGENIPPPEHSVFECVLQSKSDSDA